jgi:hypothetical protein
VGWEVERFFRGERGRCGWTRYNGLSTLNHLTPQSLRPCSLLHSRMTCLKLSMPCPSARRRPSRPPFPPEQGPPPRAAAIRTFLAIALQLGRVFPWLLEVTRATGQADRSGMRRASRAGADSVLDGACDRGRGPYVRGAIDLQRRTEPLTRLRRSRSGHTPQAVAGRRDDKVAA